jgi:hypothetical protein
MIEFKKMWGRISSRREHQAGALAYQTQINQILRAHMEGKESVDVKRLARDDRFIRAVAKRVKQLSSRHGKSTESFVPSCAYFKKSRDTKIRFAAPVRY